MLRAALAGSGVIIACVAIPIVHWVTALPAPFIGGYIAGVRCSATPGQGFMLGGLMAVVIILPVAGALAVASLLIGFSVWFAAVVGAIYLIYTASLGSLGAVAGGRSARKNPKQ